MSILDCNCPLPTAIGDITSQDCPVNFSQIQKIILQREGFVFTGTTPNDINLLSDWQTLFTATDDTKAQITPFIYNPVITAGEPVTNGGGDNTTLNGVEELVGVNPSSFTSELRSINATVERELKKFVCETKLVAYFINKNGKIICKETAEGSSEYTGIPIQNLFVGDRTVNGLNTKDINAFNFSLAEGWSNLVSLQIPAFNPLTEL